MLEEFAGRYHYFSVDVTQTAAIKQFVIDAEKLFGRIDIVVSNAGKNVFKGIDCEESDWSHNLDLNLRSHWYLAKCARPALQKSRGVILVITSNHAFSTMPGCAPYNHYQACTAIVSAKSDYRMGTGDPHRRYRAGLY